MKIKSNIGIEYMRGLNTDSLEQIVQWLFKASDELEEKTKDDRPLFNKEELQAMENDLEVISQSISAINALKRASKL